METRIGTVRASHARTATVDLEEGAVRVGDHLHALGTDEDTWVEVLGLQVDGVDAVKAGSGELVEARLDGHIPVGAEVYRLDALEAHEGDDDLRLSMPPGGPDDPIPDQQPA